ncbi:DUF6624 domain-containing protein [Lewinella sp. W8]|uniref:DUF6624 domain-containing protein n=1 Tax=Lewinella sp. W8 TaxID=2528208 RepID=UPI001067C42D|nr:DUF6624 domain-containing protein [Lewinella sp. W8]MTB50190.1 hypothetical protein [Lewinella sp. W8]
MKFFLSCCLVFSLFSCSRNDAPMDSWYLGWRMTFNLMQDRHALAAEQFDSLRTLSNDIEPQFLSVGLISLSRQGRDEEVAVLFDGLSEDVKRQICRSNSLRKAPFCAEYTVSAPADSLLSKALVQMYLNDQAVRGNVMQDVMEEYEVRPDSGLIARGMLDVDLVNRERLANIIKEYGFPTVKLVGQEAMRGAFMVIQHADRDPDWQRDQLPLVEAAVAAGDLERKDYAYLYDRIQVNSNLPQRYGSQFAKVDPVNGVAELAETEDPENLNVRRKAMGMMPIEMYRKLILSIP